jgi:hypothetical protein
MFKHDEIVETRTWRSGTEMVTRVNWSHIARVRRALGLCGDEGNRVRIEHLTQQSPVTLRPEPTWANAVASAA